MNFRAYIILLGCRQDQIPFPHIDILIVLFDSDVRRCERKNKL